MCRFKPKPISSTWFNQTVRRLRQRKTRASELYNQELSTFNYQVHKCRRNCWQLVIRQDRAILKVVLAASVDAVAQLTIATTPGRWWEVSEGYCLGISIPASLYSLTRYAYSKSDLVMRMFLSKRTTSEPEWCVDWIKQHKDRMNINQISSKNWH